jgi:hypothetical protein
MGSPLVFNGINGATGDYFTPPMLPADFTQLLLGTPPATPEQQAHLRELQQRLNRDTQAHFGPEEGIDPKKLSESGWGVIFASNADPAIREALSPLLALRKRQAGDRYKEYAGSDAPQPGETKNGFLSRHGAGPGPVVPTAVPYYVLIVADPNTVPFRFQYELDVEYAVGRVWFDSLADFAAYAQSVVTAETGAIALARRAAFFATANPGDAATQLSHDALAIPISKWADGLPSWTIDKYLNADASKNRLAGILHADAPALVFTASHGMCYLSGDPRQLANQGALVCQDWPGPSYKQAIPDSFFFSGADLSADAHVLGTILMHFACFGAGTPQLSDFFSSGPPPALAPSGFLASLPKRLLAHPRGGALAVVGHVERAWEYSFNWDQAGSQVAVFTSTLQRLIDGHPIGSALEYFNHRYSELSTELSGILQDVRLGATPDPYLIAGTWMATNDARNYTVVGDPAVRLMLSDDACPVRRPVLEVNTVSAPPAASPSPTPSAATPAPSAASPTPSAATPTRSAAAAPPSFAGAAKPAQPPPPPAAPAQPPACAPAAPAQPAPAAAFATYPTAVDYGFIDSVRSTATSLQEAAQKIGAWLSQSFENVTSVRVSTYVSEDLDAVKYADGAFTGAKLRAMTVASLDGSTVVCVPETNGQVDAALWKIHSDALEKALANRIELLRTAANAIASLVPGIKIP